MAPARRVISIVRRRCREKCVSFSASRESEAGDLPSFVDRSRIPQIQVGARPDQGVEVNPVIVLSNHGATAQCPTRKSDDVAPVIDRPAAGDYSHEVTGSDTQV